MTEEQAARKMAEAISEPLRINPPISPAAIQDRQRLIDRYITWRLETEQMFTDIAHWNDSVRKSDEAPIDPDPNGQLRAICDWIDTFLNTEAH